MAKTIKMRLSASSIQNAIEELENYKKSLREKAALLAERLAEEGYQSAYITLSDHVYTGETISSLTITQVGDTTYKLSAQSEALLFLEFGAGISGVGHPLAGEYGMGAGTYPGQTHADDPCGWWYETEDPNLAVRTSKKTGKMYGHSYGNEPYMPMYGASVVMRENLERIAKEVFGVA